jgi:hypothetical protein
MESTIDRRKAGCASGGDIQSSRPVNLPRVAIPTFFLDVVSEQVARPNRKKKKRNYDCTAGKGVFGVSGVGFDYLFFFGGSTSLRSHFSICP